jgi:hypothetical protein
LSGRKSDDLKLDRRIANPPLNYPLCNFAGDQNLRREIIDVGSATGFSLTVSLYRPLWGFDRPPAESLAGNPDIRRHYRFASCETNAVHALENC